MGKFLAHPWAFIANSSARVWLSYLEALDVSQVIEMDLLEMIFAFISQFGSFTSEDH